MRGVTLDLPAEALEAIAERAAELVAEKTPAATSSPWMTASEAGEYLRANRQRVYDLAHQGRLKAHKDGSRSLFHRRDLDDYLGGEAS